MERGKRIWKETLQPQITYDCDETTLPRSFAVVWWRLSAIDLTAIPLSQSAIEALPLETPKLTAVGVDYLTRDTFAERLEARYRPQQRPAAHRGPRS